MSPMPPAPTRGFSPAEFAARTVRAQTLMRAQGLDTLVLTTPHNIRYVTGFASQFWESPTRPWFVVVPADGAPIAVIPEIGAPQMAATWITDIRTWPAPRPADDGTSLLAATLLTAPRRTGLVGFELGREQHLRMPVEQFLDLRERVPGLSLVSGTACIQAIRMVKTQAEIDHIRHICRIACDGYDRVPDLVRTGDSEREVTRRVAMEFLSLGADSVPFLPAISGPGGVPQIVCGPNDRVLADGDILFLDTGCTYDGYWCDFDRNWAVGAVGDDCRWAHEAMWLATEAGIAAAVPGATCADVFRAMAPVIEAAGSIGNNVGRLGHGLGMQLTEPPSHMPADLTVLQPGMVITIEPGIEYAPGKMIVHEENIVVRDGGAELLTRRAPRELPRIG